MNRYVQILSIAAALLAPAVAAHAVVYYGPNGAGGFNAYELVNTSTNYAGAIAGSAVAFPGALLYGIPAGGPTGHLATFSNSADYEFIVARRIGAANDSFIGLSDDPAFAPGAIEGNNTSGQPLATNGTTASLGQRGYGWAWTDGTGFNQFHQRTPGVSIWNGGEPNGTTSESAAQVRTDGYLNDIPTGNNQTYIREWDLNLTSLPKIQVMVPGFNVTDIRNVGAVNAGNYMSIAAAPPVGAVIVTNEFAPYINYGNNNGQFRNNNGFPEFAFPQGGGDNFVLQADAFIYIPSAGPWSIQVEQDDDVYVEIGTNGAPQSINDTGCCATSFYTVNLDKGWFPIKVIFGEHGGGEHIEVSMAPGAGVTNIAQFRLIGDVANGGLQVVNILIPEPATALLGVLGLGLLSLRRRRTA